MESLKQIRNEKKITQSQAAEYLGISLRSYKSYENEKEKRETLKYKYLMQKLMEINPIDEEHGVLETEDIFQICKEVFDRYEVSFCYLFGSYAKKKAKETSDVDLLLDVNITGLMFYEIVEELREKLHKKVDVLDIRQLSNNSELLKEILKDGIKIYG